MINDLFFLFLDWHAIEYLMSTGNMVIIGRLTDSTGHLCNIVGVYDEEFGKYLIGLVVTYNSVMIPLFKSKRLTQLLDSLAIAITFASVIFFGPIPPSSPRKTKIKRTSSSLPIN
jgi:hypothetical protein